MDTCILVSIWQRGETILSQRICSERHLFLNSRSTFNIPVHTSDCTSFQHTNPCPKVQEGEQQSLAFVVRFPVPIPGVSVALLHKKWGKDCVLPTVGGSWCRLPQRIVKNEFKVFENTPEIFTCNNKLLFLFHLLASILHLAAHSIEKASFVHNYLKSRNLNNVIINWLASSGTMMKMASFLLKPFLNHEQDCMRRKMQFTIFK